MTKVVTIPTLGRVVWYKPDASESVTGKLMRADICDVLSDDVVNLGVTNNEGISYGKTSVPFFQGDADECPEGSCCWMPYQKQQAAKEAE